MNRSVTIGTVCFLIDETRDKILLLERSNHPMKDKVTGVGGKTHFEEDVYTSCLREIQEETGLVARNLNLRGIIKTVMNSLDSSWILFVYVSREFSGTLIDCPEGKLFWADRKDLMQQNLIGFIREILPAVLDGDILEGTILHDQQGIVLHKEIKKII